MQPRETGFGHAIDATEIAFIGYRNAKIGDRSTKAIDERSLDEIDRHRHIRRYFSSPKNASGIEGFQTYPESVVTISALYRGNSTWPFWATTTRCPSIMPNFCAKSA